MKFTQAIRKQAKLRLALTGPSGSGKTYSALLLAQGLGGRIAVIDTERGSASLYSHLVQFDTLELNPPYTPERFTEAIHAAEEAEYNVLIIDSITHEWSGTGGCLELNESIAKSKFKGNTWSAWNETTPRHRAFLDAINQSEMHIIATMRSKTETAQTEEGGRKRVAKLGMKAEQREGTEYEFTVVLDIVHEGHFATASKDRTGIFTDRDPQPITKTTGEVLLDWLNSGAELLPEPPAEAGKQEKGEASGILTPEQGAEDALTEDERFLVSQYAVKMAEALEADDASAVMEQQRTLRTYSAEAQAFGWGKMLDSKQRTKARKIIEEANKQAKDAGNDTK